MAPRWNFLGPLAPISVQKYGNCGYKFIYVLNEFHLADFHEKHTFPTTFSKSSILNFMKIRRTFSLVILGQRRINVISAEGLLSNFVNMPTMRVKNRYFGNL